jgi:ligand-binding sensor domain-containing protein
LNNNKYYFHIGIILSITLIFNACRKDDPEEVKYIPFVWVSGFIISDEGFKLLATDKGLYALNETNGRFEVLSNDLKITPLNDLAYSNSSAVRDLWLATDNGAFNFTARTSLTPTNSRLPDNAVKHLSFDDRNRAYFATPEGIFVLEDTEWLYTTGLDDLYLNYEITGIASSGNGFTYVTTRGGGVERFKVEADGITGATLFDKDWSGLETNIIHTVFVDDTLQVYGTDNGIAFHFSEFTKWDWMVYTTADGLISDTVLTIVKDLSDTWWFGTPEGISRLKDSEWTNHTVETHAILSDTVKFSAVDTDGSVWFASDEGLTRFLNNEWINFPK